MAQEIRLQATVTVTNGDLTAKMTDSVLVDQSNPGVFQAQQPIGNVPEVLNLGGLADPAVLYIKNTHAFHYVTLGPLHSGVMVPFMHLDPGVVNMIVLTRGVTLLAQTNDGTGTDEAIVAYMVVEN